MSNNTAKKDINSYKHVSHIFIILYIYYLQSINYTLGTNLNSYTFGVLYCF